MKSLREHLNESLLNESKSGSVNKIKFRPKDRYELRSLIERLIKERGNNADLNDIDTSGITDMDGLFSGEKFLSRLSDFNGDISKWNVSNVKSMKEMFKNNKSFNGNISKWDVSNVETMEEMFCCSIFNRDISKWNVSNVKNMYYMFFRSKFKRDLSKWDVSKVEDMRLMFKNSPLEGNEPDWYKK